MMGKDTEQDDLQAGKGQGRASEGLDGIVCKTPGLSRYIHQLPESWTIPRILVPAVRFTRGLWRSAEFAKSYPAFEMPLRALNLLWSDTTRKGKMDERFRNNTRVATNTNVTMGVPKLPET